MNNIANLFKPAHDHMLANTQAAAQILADLGAMPVERSSFNDDDWYTYNTETLELQAGRGSHYTNPAQPAPPMKTVRGMRAKSLGLWQYEGVAA